MCMYHAFYFYVNLKASTWGVGWKRHAKQRSFMSQQHSAPPPKPLDTKTQHTHTWSLQRNNGETLQLRSEEGTRLERGMYFCTQRSTLSPLQLRELARIILSRATLSPPREVVAPPLALSRSGPGKQMDRDRDRANISPSPLLARTHMTPPPLCCTTGLVHRGLTTAVVPLSRGHFFRPFLRQGPCGPPP